MQDILDCLEGPRTWVQLAASLFLHVARILETHRNQRKYHACSRQNARVDYKQDETTDDCLRGGYRSVWTMWSRAVQEINEKGGNNNVTWCTCDGDHKWSNIVLEQFRVRIIIITAAMIISKLGHRSKVGNIRDYAKRLTQKTMSALSCERESQSGTHIWGQDIVRRRIAPR